MFTFRAFIGLSTLATTTVALAPSANAQSLTTNPSVEVKNNSDETRKICFHKPKRVTLLPKGCVVLKRGERIFWNRKGVFTPFKVKIYQKRKVIDKYLYSRDLPSDTGKIIVGTGGRFGFSRFKNISKSFTIRACNNRFNETIWLAIGYDLPQQQYSRGWWGIKRGQCIDIGVSKWLKETYNIPYGRLPRLHYFARTYGNKPKFWSGTDSDKLYCINQDKQFRLDNRNLSQACNTGHEPQPYRFLAAPTQRSAEIVPLNFNQRQYHRNCWLKDSAPLLTGLIAISFWLSCDTEFESAMFTAIWRQSADSETFGYTPLVSLETKSAESCSASCLMRC